MNKWYAGFLLCLMSYAPLVGAATLGCDPYKDDPSNTLEEVNLFNAHYSEDKERGEVSPTDERRIGKILIQIWDVTPFRKPKLFFICFYKNSTYKNEKESTTTKEIPASVDTCELIRPDFLPKIPATIKPSFSCFKKGKR